MIRRRLRRASAGFTLIELLVVVVIIGVLASFAVPRFANAKGKSYAAAMRNDLHNLATAQEGHFYETQAYSGSLATLKLKPSPGVSIAIVESTSTGWSATATHAGASPMTCGIFYGSAAPVAPATAEGIVSCR